MLWNTWTWAISWLFYSISVLLQQCVYVWASGLSDSWQLKMAMAKNVIRKYSTLPRIMLVVANLKWAAVMQLKRSWLSVFVMLFLGQRNQMSYEFLWVIVALLTREQKSAVINYHGCCMLHICITVIIKIYECVYYWGMPRYFRLRCHPVRCVRHGLLIVGILVTLAAVWRFLNGSDSVTTHHEGSKDFC